jgi:uncharacterized protein YkwD
MSLPATRKRSLGALVVTFVLLAGITISAPPASAATTTETFIATSVFNLINAERALNGLPALRSNADLVQSAHVHNVMMSKYDSLAHQLGRELSLGTRIAYAGYRWSYCGENIGWNSDESVNGALYLEESMYYERAPYIPHRINILSRTYRNVGVDVYIDQVHGKLWLTEDFGTPQ